ncbi:PVRL3: Poliovirus receptor-related protein 3, partial [Crotalus adamanteus]
EYEGRVLLKNTSLTDASIILINVTFSDSGEYVCKAATFPLGNSQSSTIVAVLVDGEAKVGLGPLVLNALQRGWSDGIVRGRDCRFVEAAEHPRVTDTIDLHGGVKVILPSADQGGLKDSGRRKAVEPTVSLTKGPNPLIDGANQTVAAICTAATGKPAAEVVWEGGLGEMESTSASYPNETVTVESQYKLIPTRFARGRRIACIVRHPALEKEIRMLYVLDIQYSPEVTVTGYDGNWYIGRENVLLRCNADANPLPMEFTWSRLDGHWPEGLQPSNNTLHFNSPLSYNYTGTYICKVTNSLGQKSDQKTIYILDPPTTTTSPFTIPWLPSTDGNTGLATQPKLKFFPTSSWPEIQEDNWGTIIGSAVGGALFLILVCVLVGAVWYRRRRTFRGDYFAKNYIPPSDMQKESQIDTLQVEDVDSYPDSVKKEIKHPVNSLLTKDYMGETEKTDWNKVDTINRYQDRYERPMDYYESGTLGMKYLGDECYDENEDDLVSHVDGSVISRKEWYV